MVFVLLLLAGNAFSQHKNLSLQNQWNYEFQKQLSTKDTIAHTSMRPIRESAYGVKHTNNVLIDSGLYYYNFTQKLYKENLFIIQGEDYKFTVDPLMNFRFGQDFGDTLRIMVRNTRAIRVQGDIGEKVSFETMFYENQAKMPRYISQWGGGDRGDSKVLPGEGRTKGGNGDDLTDFGYALGYVSFTPVKWLNFQLGQGKHFIGNGYRSMLLSDFSFSYPHLKTTLDFGQGKFQYTSIFASLQSLNRIPVATTPEALFQEKFGNFHYLTYKPNSKLEIGLFEGTIYKQYVDSVGTVPVHFSAYSPVILSGVGFNGLSGENNVVLGLNAMYRLKANLQVYGQLALDDLAKGKMAFQAGVKSFDAFGMNNLYIQLEYNNALPNTYAVSNDNLLQNYAHFGGELAHPQGASFQEFVGIAHYEKNNFFGQVKLVSVIAKQQNDGYGKSIFQPDELPENLDPIDQDVFTNVQDFQFGYKFNVKTNMYAIAGLRNRVYAAPNGVDNSIFFYIGFRTNLNNLYYDF